MEVCGWEVMLLVVVMESLGLLETAGGLSCLGGWQCERSGEERVELVLSQGGGQPAAQGVEQAGLALHLLLSLQVQRLYSNKVQTGIMQICANFLESVLIFGVFFMLI